MDGIARRFCLCLLTVGALAVLGTSPALADSLGGTGFDLGAALVRMSEIDPKIPLSIDPLEEFLDPLEGEEEETPILEGIPVIELPGSVSLEADEETPAVTSVPEPGGWVSVTCIGFAFLALLLLGPGAQPAPVRARVRR